MSPSSSVHGIYEALIPLYSELIRKIAQSEIWSTAWKWHLYGADALPTKPPRQVLLLEVTNFDAQNKTR